MLVLAALHLKHPVISDFTFSATAHACQWASGKFSVVDCCPKTFNMAQSPPIGADGILATHVFGCPADIGFLQDQADDLPLLFDGAHALGATYKGTNVANWGLATVHSFSATKQISAGDGGMIVSNDPMLSEKLRKMRNYANEPDYDCKDFGLSARLTEFASIIGLESLGNFKKNQIKRNRLVQIYQDELDGIQMQETTPESSHAWKDFSIILEPNIKNRVMKALDQASIPFKQYFRPISSISCFPLLRGYTPMSRLVWKSIIQLPLHTNLSESEVEGICKVVMSAINGDSLGRGEVSVHGTASTVRHSDSRSVVNGKVV